MTILAIDPGTHALGWAIYEDGKAGSDGLWRPEWKSPLDYLTQLENFLATCDPDARGRPAFDTLATEQMFIDPFRGAKNSALLAVSVKQMRAWALEAGVEFHEFSNGTVKKAVAGNGRAKKGAVLLQTRHLVSDATRKAIRAMSDAAKTRRELLMNVSDAHAIALTALWSMTRHLKTL